MSEEEACAAIVVEDSLGVRVSSRAGHDIEIATVTTRMLLRPEQVAALLHGPLHRALINALKSTEVTQ